MLDGPDGTHRLLAVACDVTSSEDVERAFTEIERSLGPVTVLVCAAGITDDTLLLRMSEERWGNVIETNLASVYRTTKRVLGPMARGRRGRIILISSVVAFMGSPGQANYGASKAALVGFARSLAREVASRSITVNVVAPGVVTTDMIAVLGVDRVTALTSLVPLGRQAGPDEVASAVQSWPQAAQATSPGPSFPWTGASVWATDPSQCRQPTRESGIRMDNEATFDKFKACAVEILNVPEEKVTLDANFASDLDADSLDLVELVMELEEVFSITVDESELEGVETIGQAYELVTSKL